MTQPCDAPTAEQLAAGNADAATHALATRIILAMQEMGGDGDTTCDGLVTAVRGTIKTIDGKPIKVSTVIYQDA